MSVWNKSSFIYMYSLIGSVQYAWVKVSFPLSFFWSKLLSLSESRNSAAGLALFNTLWHCIPESSLRSCYPLLQVPMDLFHWQSKHIQGLEKVVPSFCLISVPFPCSSFLSHSTPETVGWVRELANYYERNLFEFTSSWIVELISLSAWFHGRVDCPFHWF